MTDISTYRGIPDNCPKCKAQWKGDDIYQFLLIQQFYFCQDARHSSEQSTHEVKTDEEIYRIAQSYGYTHENPTYFRKVVGVEYPFGHPKRFDGASLWHCPECKGYWDRFTGQKITPNFKDRR